MLRNDILLFQSLIQELRESATRMKSKGDVSSLLHNTEQLEREFYAGLFDLDYIRNFLYQHVESRIPFYILPVILEQVKKYTGIQIPPYSRDEKRNRNLNILKSCKIYHDFYEKFQYLTFQKKSNTSGRITKEQIIPNEKLDIPSHVRFYIFNQWNYIAENTQIVQQNIFNKLLELNPQINGVIMFQFDDLIFIIPFKRLKANVPTYILMDTAPISLTNISIPPLHTHTSYEMQRPSESSIPSQYRITNFLN